MVEEEEVLKSHLLAACGKMVASKSWEGWGLCKVSGEGASLCFVRMRKVLWVPVEHCYDRLC